jgi:hypothetical protein
MNLTNRWMNDPNYLAQVGHFLFGLALVFVLGVFFGEHAAVLTLAIGSLVSAVKEFGYDARYEIPAQTWKDNLTDFAFYLLGGGAGLGLFLLALHVRGAR